MRRLVVIFLPLVLMVSAAAHAQTESDRVAPTIPETQIEPAEISSAYEFLSVATSADEFVIEAAGVAEAKADAPEVKALAQELATAHTGIMKAITEAGGVDNVEIAAPSEDGEQQQLLGRLETLEGKEFDPAYVEAQLFVYQRTIAYYKGYAEKGDSLAKFAADTLPELVARYESLLALAETVGIGTAAQTPSAQ